ncbi:hypothetical protein [Nocardia crassostreae]|uniref:hypothetical protein n=1 Tax=Nocardia crassostreae TaxID=53428 RepID=UPI00082D84B1|nr:hypothetical protein [Nocardia crassostreae]
MDQRIPPEVLAAHRQTGDPAKLNLRMRLYPESALDGMLDQLVARPLAPGLLETVVLDTPQHMSVLNRGQLEAREEDIFAAALALSIGSEEHLVDTSQLSHGHVTFISGRHRYVGSHIHVLARHFASVALPYGALVAFPLPEYVMIYPLGQTGPVESLVDVQDVAQRLFDSGSKPLTKRIFWWIPGHYEQFLEPEALRSGLVPDLRPVGIDIDGHAREIKLLTAETNDLFRALGQ